MRFLVAAMSVYALGLLIQEPKPEKPAPLKTPTLETFKEKCARCHGPNGSALIPGFADKRTKDELHEVVQMMVEGPGATELAPRELDGMDQFIRALSAKAAFITWTKQEGSELSGETSPDAKIEAFLGKEPLEVVIKEGKWSLTLPSLDRLPDLVVRAQIEDRVSEMKPSKLPFSLLVEKEPGG